MNTTPGNSAPPSNTADEVIQRLDADNILLANRHPLGIPPLFLADQLSHGLAPDEVLQRIHHLVDEYAGTHGYSYSWGQLQERKVSSFLLWRVIPVQIWEDLTDERSGKSYFITDLVTQMRPQIEDAVRSELPNGITLPGLHAPRLHSQHAVASFLLHDMGAKSAVRSWLANRFLGELLPKLLAGVRSHASRLLVGGKQP